MNLSQQIFPHEIGFDFDGVIADTGAAFIRIACEEYNYCSFSLEDITNFELEGCIDIPSRMIDAIFVSILKDSLATGLEPMAGAVPVLTELAEHAPITIITARPIKQPVVDWLNCYYPAKTVDNCKVVVTGDHNDKLRYIQEHNLKYFVDDRADTCKDLTNADITSLVFSQPWNKNGHNLPTVNGWQEIKQLIKLP